MNLKPLAPIWLASWAALAPVGLMKMGSYGFPIDRQILGAALFTLPLSCPAAFAAIIGLYIRRRQTDDGAWRLAAWFAVAATFWAGTSVLAMNAARQSQSLGDDQRQALTMGFVGAVSSLIAMVDAVMYFAQPRLGMRRLAVAISVAAAITTMIVLAFIAGAEGSFTATVILLIGELGLLAGVWLLFMGLAGLAATRWVRSGFVIDKHASTGATHPIEVRS